MNRATVCFMVVVAALPAVTHAQEHHQAGKTAKTTAGGKAKKATPEQQAQQAAQSWLALTDAGKYAQSWDAASPSFKSALTRQKWAEALNSVRSPLGKAKSRKLLTAKYSDSLPNAPKGEYVVVQYETAFTQQGALVETVVLTKDRDGRWRTAGYFIKPR